MHIHTQKKCSELAKATEVCIKTKAVYVFQKQQYWP